MTELPRQHHDLAPVVTLVRDEVRQHMRDVERQVAPYITLRRRHTASRGDAQLKERFDARATPPESREQLTAPHLAEIDQDGNRQPMFLAERPEPPAPGVMKVRRNHSHCAPWRTGNRRIPECHREVLNEVRSHAAIGSPGSQEHRR